jgi:acetate kinase
VFCYQARKFIGAYAAALGGLDTLVFTGGIGEHGPEIRGRICSGLEFIGVRLDAAANNSHAPVISAAGSAVTVRVIVTNEELMIARHTQRVLETNNGVS